MVDLGGGDSGCEAYASLPPAAVCFPGLLLTPPPAPSLQRVFPGDRGFNAFRAGEARRSLPDAPRSNPHRAALTLSCASCRTSIISLSLSARRPPGPPPWLQASPNPSHHFPGMLCSVTVVGGVGIIVGACFHQNYKHGFLK